MDSATQQKLLSALCHGAVFFDVSVVSVALPLAMFFITDDLVVKANSKESLNFHLNIYLYLLIFSG